ncbi:MAG TPA: hypothetical protein GX697_01655 [Firmicutes bacterium]|nr:hypothetical protein [Bacillota bacterium]
MEITLQQIDMIRERTGVGYEEARRALEASGGSVIDALVLLEKRPEEFTGRQEDDENESFFEQVRQGDSGKKMAPIAGLVGRAKINVETAGGRQVRIPAVLGAAGAVLAPKAVLFTGLALLLFKCKFSLDYSNQHDPEPDEPS